MELHIRDVSKTYSNGGQALKDVTLTVPAGMYGLLGPNGAAFQLQPTQLIGRPLDPVLAAHAAALRFAPVAPCARFGSEIRPVLGLLVSPRLDPQSGHLSASVSS